jgi:hypothetical protein
MNINRIKITEFPIKDTITNNEYVVVIENNQNYLMGLSSYFDGNFSQFDTLIGELSATTNSLAEITNTSSITISSLTVDVSNIFDDINTLRDNEININSELDTKAPILVNGISLSDTDYVSVSSHLNGYLIFTNSNTKTYMIVEDPTFPVWGKITLRNNATQGNLLVGYDYGITLDGDQGKLLVLSKETLELVKVEDLKWHIL